MMRFGSGLWLVSAVLWVAGCGGSGAGGNSNNKQSQTAPSVTAWPTASSITVGETLASSMLTGGAASVVGTFAFTSPSTMPAAGTSSESVTFTPTDTADYSAVTGTVMVTVNAAGAPSAVAVDFGTTYQTIRGFGGSTAWLGQMPTAVATALFNPTSGLGLSMLRVRIDPTGSSTSSPYPFETTESGGWSDEAANGKEALAANPNAIVFATPWTPPAIWKLNGNSNFSDDGMTWNQSFNASCGTNYCGGYLDPNHYGDYANYLEDFVKYFNATAGFSLYAVSMQNEPEENVSYESCVWTPEEMDSWVAGDASAITSDAYSTKLIMPESENFNPIDASVALNDSHAQGLISIVGGHLYGVQPTPYSIPAGDSPKEIWMTEFGPLSTATPTWSQALTTYAESIHDSMVTGEYNAYLWWGLFGTSPGANGGATNAGTFGLVGSDGTSTVIGWVFGQYAKFIQPGYLRASATANPAAGIYASAYTGSASGTQHYVIVAINASSSAQSMAFTLSNGTVTAMTPYQSTSAAGLVAQTPVTVTSGKFNYTLPAQSITTFVQ
jgi:glucuronoarabinoxylan endo-1,4-beta-xylanase